jgi:hypothetical protein
MLQALNVSTLHLNLLIHAHKFLCLLQGEGKWRSYLRIQANSSTEAVKDYAIPYHKLSLCSWNRCVDGLAWKNGLLSFDTGMLKSTEKRIWMRFHVDIILLSLTLLLCFCGMSSKFICLKICTTRLLALLTV